MRRVIIETPFKGRGATEAEREADRRANIDYAERCARHCLMERHEVPFASHLLYTRMLRDEVPEERNLGIVAGLIWGSFADATIVYTDRGVTDGMRLGIENAKRFLRIVEYRQLPGYVSEQI